MFDRLRRTFKSWFRIGQIDELSPNLPKVDFVFATKDLLEQAQRQEKSAGPWAFRLGMTCRLLDRAACRMALERLALIDPMAAEYEGRQLKEASADKLISRQFGERPAELTSISN